MFLQGFGYEFDIGNYFIHPGDSSDMKHAILVLVATAARKFHFGGVHLSLQDRLLSIKA
jgi:hypothetical protein